MQGIKNPVRKDLLLEIRVGNNGLEMTEHGKGVSKLNNHGSGVMVNPGTAQEGDSWCWVQPYLEDEKAKV